MESEALSDRLALLELRLEALVAELRRHITLRDIDVEVPAPADPAAQEPQPT